MPIRPELVNAAAPQCGAGSPRCQAAGMKRAQFFRPYSWGFLSPFGALYIFFIADSVFLHCRNDCGGLRAVFRNLGLARLLQLHETSCEWHVINATLKQMNPKIAPTQSGFPLAGRACPLRGRAPFGRRRAAPEVALPRGRFARKGENAGRVCASFLVHKKLGRTNFFVDKLRCLLYFSPKPNVSQI